MWFQNDAHKKLMEELKEKHSDITLRTIQCKDETITILYIRQLTSRECLANFVIRPLVEYCRTAKHALKASEAIDSVLYADECFLGQEGGDVERHILGGETVILFSGDKEYAVVNLVQVEHRPVSGPEMHYNQRAPRDSFVENIDVNLSLLRYRLKDGSLRVEHMNVGQRTRTRIAMVFIEDIANDTAVREMRKRIHSIDTDGFLESGELQACLMNDKFCPFPQMMVIERSDMAAENLLEGKVVLIVDGSPYAIAAPVTFVEFMYACDDRYESKYMGMFMRLLRYMAFFISFSASSYWVAVVAFHSDVLPAGFIIAVAQARAKVPFNALVGVLLLEFIVELIRESLIRVPTKIGSAIAIVGALIIGQASIAAGIFSPLLLIIV